MRGDFVLYKAKPGDIADWVIEKTTNGPFVHCEIDLGNNLFMGEHGKGITIHPRDMFIPSQFVTPKSTLGPKGIAAGMDWVDEVGREAQKNGELHGYGWRDVASDAFKVFGWNIVLGKSRSGEWDCSHFVALYLQKANADGPLGSQMKTPETISPNDLARAYGVIK
jgi:hypothetical protein